MYIALNGAVSISDTVVSNGGMIRVNKLGRMSEGSGRGFS